MRGCRHLGLGYMQRGGTKGGILYALLSFAAALALGADACLADRVTAIGAAGVSPYILGAFADDAVFVTSVDQVPQLRISEASQGSSRRISMTDPAAEPVLREGISISGKFLFTAKSPSAGEELWQTDGTVASLVADLSPGPFADTHPYSFVAARSLAFFISAKGSPEAIYRSDGTEFGTFAIGSTTRSHLLGGTTLMSYKNGVLFKGCAFDAPADCGVVSSDGTRAGTRLLVRTSQTSELVAVEIDGTAYFVAAVQDSPTRRVWRLFSTEGSPETTRARATLAESDFSEYFYLGTLQGSVLVSHDLEGSPKLYRLEPDGKLTTLYDGGSGGVTFSRITDLSTKAYFYSASAPNYFSTDGTSAGSGPITDDLLKALTWSVQFKGAFYFTSTDAVYGKELWRCYAPDRDACSIVKDFNPGLSSSDIAFFGYGSEGAYAIGENRMFLTARTGSGPKVFSLEPGDYCPEDAGKEDPGMCGCGIADNDVNQNGVADCNEYFLTGLVPSKPQLRNEKNGVRVEMQSMPRARWEVSYSVRRKKGLQRLRRTVRRSETSSLLITRGLKRGDRVTVSYRLESTDTALPGRSEASPTASIVFKPRHR